MSEFNSCTLQEHRGNSPLRHKGNGMGLLPKRRHTLISSAAAVAVRNSNRATGDLLPWLPPPRPDRRLRTLPSHQRLTNTSVLKSITNRTLTPKQLLSLYSLAAKQLGFRHDYPTYKALTTSLAEKRCFRSVELLLSRMRREGHPCGPGILLPLLDIYAAVSDFSDRTVVQDVFLSEPVHEKVFSRLVSLVISGNQIDMARVLFSDDVVSKLGFNLKVRHYVDLLRAYCDRGDFKSVVELLDAMAVKGLVPNVFCYGSLISRACHLGSGYLDTAIELMEQMRRRGREPDLVIWNTLVYGCVRYGKLEKVETILKEMEINGIFRDVWTFNTLIGGLCKHQSVEDGVRIFFNMVEGGVVPDVATFTTLIEWLCRERKVIASGVLFAKMVRMGIVPDAACWRILVGEFSEKQIPWEMTILLQKLLSNKKSKA